MGQRRRIRTLLVPWCSGYEIRLTVNSGEDPNGFSPAKDVWHSLSTNRDFRLTTSTIEELNAEWLIEIRVASGNTVASMVLTVYVNEFFI